MTRAPWRQRLAYHCLVRAAGRTRTGIGGRLWTGAWLRLTPGMSGTSRVEIHGSRVVVNAGYAYPAFYRRWTRYNDPLVELVQRTHLHRGRPITVVDVGAAVGDTALLVMDRCPGAVAEFWCVEPDDEFFGYLTHNLGHRPDVHLVNAMLSGGASTAPSLVRTHSGTASPQGAEAVTATTADEVLADATHVDVVKIDTDGYDGQVLQGARQLLRTHRPSVVFEWHPILLAAVDQDWATPFEVLVEWGYEWFVWFTKEGDFSHLTHGFDRDAAALLAELCVSERAPGPDWHYDVVALPADGPSPVDVASLVHAAATRR